MPNLWKNSLFRDEVLE